MIVFNQDFVAILSNCSLSLPAKVALYLLKHHHNPRTGQCNPKVETLAQEMCLPLRNAQRAIAELKTGEWISTKRKGHFCHYEILRWPERLRTAKMADQKHEEPPPVADLNHEEPPPVADLNVSHPYYLKEEILKRKPTAVAAVESKARDSASSNGHRAAAAARVSPKKNPKPSEFCLELLAQHPHPQQPEKAEVELQRALLSAPAEVIRERHRAWREYWETYQPRFIPFLWRWFADGDWLIKPKKPAKRRTQEDDVKTALANSRLKVLGAAS